MFTKPKEPRTLERADPRMNILQNDIIIRISVTSAIILAFLLFIIVCFILVPPTYGFLWW